MKKLAMVAMLSGLFAQMPLTAKTIEKHDNSVVVVHAPSMSIGDLGFRVICGVTCLVTLKATIGFGATSMATATGAAVCTVGSVLDSTLLIPAVGLAGCSLVTGGIAYCTGSWTYSLFNAAINRNSDIVVVRQSERE